MKFSIIKTAWKAFTGFINPWGSAVANVFEYLADRAVDTLNSALGSISEPNKEKMQGALNVAKKCLSVLNAIGCFCPTRWQTAYRETVAAVTVVIDALSDLEITSAEFTKVRGAFNAAVLAWKSGDDDTCVAL